MDLYINEENLRSFIKAKDRDEYPDCLRMMRRQLHLVYNNIDKTSLKNDPELMQWVMKASEGRGDSEEKDTFCHEIFTVRPIKPDIYKNWDRKQLSSVYLINSPICNELKSSVLIEGIGEEIPTLMKLFCGMDYDFHHLYDLQKNFNSWEQLTDDNQILPCTDIILSDRYIFKNQQQLVEHNLGSMLRVLVKNVRNCVNIVVFTMNESISSFGYENVKKIINDVVKDTTNVKPKITFVTSNDNGKITHDRFIITNYRLIRSGDSFIYFNTQGEKITNGGSLDIDSLANNETYTFVGSLLEKLQNSIDEIYKLNKDMIIGDKASNFVRFEKE